MNNNTTNNNNNEKLTENANDHYLQVCNNYVGSACDFFIAVNHIDVHTNKPITSTK